MKDLSKKKLGQLSKALENSQVAFRFQVDQIAEEARSEILPYFKKHKLDFVTGNGTWYITRLGGRHQADQSVSDDDLPKNIRDLLMLEVDRNMCLGFYIRNIHRGEW